MARCGHTLCRIKTVGSRSSVFSAMACRRMLLSAAAIALVIRKKKKNERKKRSKWVKDWLLKRSEFSHTNLLEELRVAPEDWHNYLRMDENTYLELLELVTPLIKKQDTKLRDSISPHERLSATLRFLVTGRSYEDMKFSTLISPQALGNIIPETCEAIYLVLNKKYLKVSNNIDISIIY